MLSNKAVGVLSFKIKHTTKKTSYLQLQNKQVLLNIDQIKRTWKTFEQTVRRDRKRSVKA